MQFATKLRYESNAAYQINPIPILDINEYAKKEVGGRGGAYKYYIYLMAFLYGLVLPSPVRSQQTADRCEPILLCNRRGCHQSNRPIGRVVKIPVGNHQPIGRVVTIIVGSHHRSSKPE